MSLRAQLQLPAGTTKPVIVATYNAESQDGARCNAVAWVPRSEAATFASAHANGSVLVYRKVGRGGGALAPPVQLGGRAALPHPHVPGSSARHCQSSPPHPTHTPLRSRPRPLRPTAAAASSAWGWARARRPPRPLPAASRCLAAASTTWPPRPAARAWRWSVGTARCAWWTSPAARCCRATRCVRGRVCGDGPSWRLRQAGDGPGAAGGLH
jgi:hypothetical protein